MAVPYRQGGHSIVVHYRKGNSSVIRSLVGIGEYMRRCVTRLNPENETAAPASSPASALRRATVLRMLMLLSVLPKSSCRPQATAWKRTISRNALCPNGRYGLIASSKMTVAARERTLREATCKRGCVQGRSRKGKGIIGNYTTLFCNALATASLLLFTCSLA